MKLCIIGAGAVGSYLACKLSQAGDDVHVLARGDRLAAIRARGIRMTRATGSPVAVSPAVSDLPGDLGQQDIVLVCVKSCSVPDACRFVPPLMSEETRVVFVQNGIPWWYFAAEAGDVRFEALDPGGQIASAVPLSRTIGCVAYVNVRNDGPGMAHHVSDDTIILGQPDGRASRPLEELARSLERAGVQARVTDRIRDEIWIKLWGNLAFNPISALTGATMDEIISEPATRPVVIAMMTEARAVAGALGVSFKVSLEQRLATALGAGKFKTSMLQDVEAGRPIEIGAIVDAVIEAGRRASVSTPTIDVVAGLLHQMARIRNLQWGPGRP
jgi:2-dehydropantoate 2-reductase